MTASGSRGLEIEPLTGNNFQSWKDSFLLHLGWHEVDLALRESKPVEPAKGATGYAELKKAYDTKVEKWERSNRMALLIMNFSISTEIKGAIPPNESAAEYLKLVEEQFKGSEKVYADELLHKLLAKYDGHGNVREHILSMSNAAAKLKTMKCDLNEELLVLLVFRSLPSQFNPFKINYNSLEIKWKLPELIAHCVQEEERIKSEQKDQAFHVSSGKRKHENHAHNNNVPNKKQYSKKNPPKPKQCNEASCSRPAPSAATSVNLTNAAGERLCNFCKLPNHVKADCPGFLKWLNKKGKDEITLVDESLYVDFSESTWWIDSGATVHVANSLQGFHISHTLKGTRRLNVANGKEAEVEAVGSLTLKLHTGFLLQLKDVLYVPTLSRNLISVSCLDDFGFHCTFGEKQCFLKYCNKDVGLAVRRGKLYMLNLSGYPMCVNLCEMNMNERNHKKNGRSINPSSKLWHRRLGHISRGRMERLIKEEILHPLDFSDAGNCIDCIKGKYVKTIKKGAVRATSVLELIHTDICGPFNVKSMDGFDSFITFTDDFSRYGYIYPIRDRSEALDKFKIYKAEVENQLKLKIKVVRYDRGVEYY